MPKSKNKVLVEIIGLEYILMKNLKGRQIRTIRIIKDKIPCWQKYCKLKADYKIYLSNKHTFITYLCSSHYKQLKKFLS
jgi:hypothetical protein